MNVGHFEGAAITMESSFTNDDVGFDSLWFKKLCINQLKKL